MDYSGSSDLVRHSMLLLLVRTYLTCEVATMHGICDTYGKAMPTAHADKITTKENFVVLP